MRPRLRHALPVAAVLGNVLSLALGAVWPPALLACGAYLSACIGASLVGAAALKSVCGLWAGPAMAAMHLAWGAGFLFQTIRSLAR
jgi:succinoglycan biosynthesis protein ExoA